MRLIIGLGNPGEEYDRTRHNIGFRVIDHFAKRHRIRLDTHERDAMVGRGRVAGQGVVVAKPLIYMNRSGPPVASLAHAYTETPEEMMIVYDDIDLPLGKIRIRPGGSAGTHNGMKSILASLEHNRFPRLRIGIRGAARSPEDDLADYVLEEFLDEEEAAVIDAVERAADALVLFARGDLNRAMNQFNRDSAPEGPTDRD
jgi:PTH1 family peptidyl-tRNA hydrolase